MEFIAVKAKCLLKRQEDDNKSPISQKGENPKDSGWILSSVRENFPQKGRLSGNKRGLKGIVGH